MTRGAAGIGEPGEPVEVPFRGLRRNAFALAGGLILLLVIVFLVPDLSPPPTQPPAVELLRGTIVELLPTTGTGRARMSGSRSRPVPGQARRSTGSCRVRPGPQDLPRYNVGDEVVINASHEPDGEVITVGDLYRIPVLAILLGIFAVAVTVVGGWRGVRSLIALALTLVVIIKIVVPLILAGRDPVWVAILAATGVTIATFLLTEGFRRRPSPPGSARSRRWPSSPVLALMFDQLARFTQFRGSEDATYLQAVGLPNIDIGGLLLAGIIFGALGILDDVTLTQAATVSELNEASPSLVARGAGDAGDERRPVAHRGHRQHPVPRLRRRLAAAHRPVRRRSPGPAPDRVEEVVAVEVVRAVVGSIGIVLAVPLTTAVAAALVDRSLPLPAPTRRGRRLGRVAESG